MMMLKEFICLRSHDLYNNSGAHPYTQIAGL